ncbi:flavodoxin family protein [Chloroflexota bacterium]
MKVLGIVCSPRKGGNTEILVNEALSSAKELSVEVELINITGKNIAPCDGCESCTTTKRCRIEDDMQEIYSKLLEADGVIFGTPVYFWNITAQAKALIDRTFALREGRKLRNKVAGVIVVARRGGASQAFSAFRNFFNIQRMPSPGGAMAYADKKGDVTQDSQGMAEARALGRSVTRAIQRYKQS